MSHRQIPRLRDALWMLLVLMSSLAGLGYSLLSFWNGNLGKQPILIALVSSILAFNQIVSQRERLHALIRYLAFGRYGSYLELSVVSITFMLIVLVVASGVVGGLTIPNQILSESVYGYWTGKWDDSSETNVWLDLSPMDEANIVGLILIDHDINFHSPRSFDNDGTLRFSMNNLNYEIHFEIGFEQAIVFKVDTFSRKIVGHLTKCKCLRRIIVDSNGMARTT